MSIKRISRIRVATPTTEYVYEDPLTANRDTKDELNVNLNIDLSAGAIENSRTGGDVETKGSAPTESRVGSNIDTRSSPTVGSKLVPTDR